MEVSDPPSDCSFAKVRKREGRGGREWAWRGKERESGLRIEGKYPYLLFSSFFLSLTPFLHFFLLSADGRTT